jgi:hypothetical protein
LTITNTAPDQTVSIASGTGISATGTYPAFTVTNTAPDQVVALTAGTGISTSGTYPNFTITNTSPSLGGDVVGPASATDNAIARFDTTTGKLLQNSVVTVGDTGATTGITTLSASTSVTTPIVQASNSGGLALKNSAGTTQMSMGAGGGDNASINVSTNINGTNAQIDISPTGTGHVHMKPTGTGSIEIAPTNVGTIDNMTLGATTPKNASVVDLSVTGTLSFDAAQGTAGQVLTSAGTGVTPTWTTPTTGTVTSVTGTAPVVSSGGNTPAISMPAATTSVNGYLTSTDWTTFNGKAPAVTYTTNYVPYGQGTTTPALSSNFQFNGTTLTLTNDASISGLTVGKGGGSIASNTVVGSLALANSSNTGSQSVAVGAYALNANTTGVYNNAVGWAALYANTTGSNNVALGMQTLASNTTASNNTAVGYQAAYANTTGYSVSAFGQGALKSNTTGAQSTAVGGNSLTAATTADNNTALGFQAGFKTTTGSSNVMVGLNAMYENTTGGSNTAIGQQTLNNNTTATNNTALGYQAGYSNTVASYNTFIGNQAGYSFNGTGASQNVYIGHNSGYSSTSNNTNTFVGNQTGYSVTTGSGNAFFGYNAGQAVTTGTGNAIFGSYDGNSGGLDIRTANGYVVLADGYGNWKSYFNGAAGGWYQTNNSTLWAITSDARIKKNITPLENGLSTILALQPKEFDYIISGQHDVGFVAQDYEQVLPLQTTEQDASGEYAELTGGDKVKGIQQNLVPYLVKAIQELKAEFDAYKATHP